MRPPPPARLAQAVLADDLADLWLRLNAGWLWLDASLAFEISGSGPSLTPDQFRAVRLVNRGTALRWPNGLHLQIHGLLQDHRAWQRQGLLVRARSDSQRGWCRPLLVAGHPLPEQTSPRPTERLQALLQEIAPWRTPLPPLPPAWQDLHSQRLLDLLHVLMDQHHEPERVAARRLFDVWPLARLALDPALNSPWAAVARGQLALVERALPRPPRGPADLGSAVELTASAPPH